MRKYMTIEEFFKTQSREKNNKRKFLKYILIVLCLSIILFSLFTIFNWCKDNSKIRQINQRISQNIKILNNDKSGELVNPPKNKDSSYYYYVNKSFYQVDFSPLINVNKDTVAFIHLKNTNINYPVVQGKDNKYYLNHDFDNHLNEAGWIFMDYRNDFNNLDDNLDDNTVIYGHARLDGAMFGSLRNTLTSYWQDEKDNYVIYLSTLKEDMLFQIFSIYKIQKESYYMTTNFLNAREKKKWIKTMQKRNLAPITTEVNENDKFLTLSTCQAKQDGRIVIQAKLIKKQSK